RVEAENCVNVTVAKLKLTAAGPAKRHLRTPTRYAITVTNEGTAMLNEIRLAATLTPQVSLVTASDDGRSVGSDVQWSIGRLAPASSRTVELLLSGQASGRFCSRILAAAIDRGISEQAEVCTDFTGVPALWLTVEDSNDPVQVGSSTTYDITVHNS